MTDADRIRAYLARHPEARPADVVEALGVTHQAVYAASRRSPRAAVRVPRVSVSLTLPDALVRELRREARRRGLSVSRLVEERIAPEDP